MRNYKQDSWGVPSRNLDFQSNTFLRPGDPLSFLPFIFLSPGRVLDPISFVQSNIFWGGTLLLFAYYEISGYSPRCTTGSYIDFPREPLQGAGSEHLAQSDLCTLPLINLSVWVDGVCEFGYSFLLIPFVHILPLRSLLPFCGVNLPWLTYGKYIYIQSRIPAEVPFTFPENYMSPNELPSFDFLNKC